jgi:hypothetical protein
MNQRTATSNNTAVGALLAAALVSGTFASATLGSAPNASASCASFFGVGAFNFATALGGGATAVADGFASLAAAAGNDGARNRPFPADAT